MEPMYMLLDTQSKTVIINKLHDYIDKHCIFRCNPDVYYSESSRKGTIPANGPGKNFENQYMFFLRRLTHNFEMMTYVSALFFDDLYLKIQAGDEQEYFQLCGLETSSIPMLCNMQAYASMHKINVNFFTIRKKRKSYGLFNLVDGIPTEAPIIIVDDNINSGGSITRIIDTCTSEYNLNLSNNVYTIIKMNNKMDQIEYNNKRMNVTSVFAADAFDLKYDKNKYWIPFDCDRTKKPNLEH